MNNEPQIANILLKYKTDKNHGSIPNIYKDLDTWEICPNPDPMIGHSYGSSYDEIFRSFDRNAPLNILEIGIQKGGSLCAWKDYFPNANIYGIDIRDEILPEYRRLDFHYLIMDVKNPKIHEILKNVSFDIIIDDGSHLLGDVLFVVKNFLGKLNVDGQMIIEDVQMPIYWINNIINIIPVGYELATKDLRKHTPYSGGDNFLIIIKKVNNK